MADILSTPPDGKYNFKESTQTEVHSETLSLPVTDRCRLVADVDVGHLAGQVGLVCKNDANDRYSETVYGFRGGSVGNWPDTRFWGMQVGTYLNGGEVRGVSSAFLTQEADNFYAVGVSPLSYARENLVGAFLGTNGAKKNMTGINVGLANVSGGNMSGVQLALSNLAGGNLKSLALSALNYAHGNAGGLVFGALGNWVDGNMSGWKWGNFFNYAGGNMDQFNVAPFGVNVAGGNMNGTNTALFGNLAGSNLSGALSTQGVNLAGGSIAGVAVPTAKANLAGEDLTGTFVGVPVNAALRDVDGFTSAGLFQFAGRDMKGTNVGGYVNVALRDMIGQQQAQWLNWAGGRMVGVQGTGAANVAESFGEGIHAAPLLWSEEGPGVGVSFGE